MRGHRNDHGVAKGQSGMKINRIKTDKLKQIKTELESKGQADSKYYQHITEELAIRGQNNGK